MPPLHVLIAELAQHGQVRYETAEEGYEARLVVGGEPEDLCCVAESLPLATYRLWLKAFGTRQEVCA